MRVRPRNLPRLLRGIAWTSITIGLLGAVALALAAFEGREVRPGRLVNSFLWVWGGYRTLRGYRDGVDSLLAAWVLPALALFALPFSSDGQRAAIPGWLYAYTTFALGVTGYLLHCRQRLSWARTIEHEPGSYDHWLTEPSARQGVADWFAHRDATLAADAASPPDPRELIATLTDPAEDFELNRMRLRQLVEQSSDSCIAPLIEGIGDPAIQRDEQSLKLLLGLLPEPAPIQAAPPLRVCAERSTGAIGDVLEALAETGDPAHLDLLVPALGSAATARDVAAGLARAFKAGRVTPAHVQLTVPALAAVLDGPAHRGAAQAARALIALDGAAAAERILSDIDVDHSGRLEAIEELHAAGVEIPQQVLTRLWQSALALPEPRWLEVLLPMVLPDESGLLEVIARCEVHPERYRACRASSAALRRLVDLGSPNARDALEAAIAKDEEDLSDTAAGLLCRLHDLPESPFVDPTRADTDVARFHHTLSLASSYARNGGIVHALECLDDDEASVLEEGLRTVGPPEVAEIWREAVRLLMRGPIPGPIAERQELIATWRDAVHARLEALDRAFYDVDHRLDVALCRYAIAHADEIRSALLADGR
jgi:hypothetical protein